MSHNQSEHPWGEFWCGNCGEPKYKCYCNEKCKNCNRKLYDCIAESETGYCQGKKKKKGNN